MPEGPEIRRAADRVAAALVPHVARVVWFGLDHLKPYEKRLVGVRVIAVDTRGKAMLTRFANGLTLYTHNQLYGRWFTGAPFETPATNRSLRLAIHNDKGSAWLYSASDIAVLTADELAEQPFLRKLGPDVLHAATTSRLLRERMGSSVLQRRRLGTLLTDQSFVAGIGAYLRSEILHSCALHPERRLADCSDSQRACLADAMLRLPRQSYATGGITNGLTHAERLKADGVDFEQYRFLVFRREGEACYRCGAPIEKRVKGGQVYYLCPACQLA